MKKRSFLKKYGLTLLTGSLLAGPAAAGVPDGNSNVNVNVTTSTVTTRDVTEITNEVILEQVWQIVGTAYRENKKGKTPPPKFWNIEMTVSDPEFATALADVKAELYDLAVIPGRRNSYSVVEDEKTGEDNLIVSQSYSEVVTGSSTETSQTWDAGTAQFGVDYIGDPNNYATWIAIGPNDVNVDVNQVTVTTEMVDAITSTEYQSTAVWSVTGVQSVSPILLDLDGDGAIEASGGQWLPHKEVDQKRLAFFDFHGDQFPVLMEWPGPNDGILCKPDGQKTMTGLHLFGTSTGFRDGYEALSVLDQNDDKVLNGAELAGLEIWQDMNSDARLQNGELKSLSDLNISQINLKHKKYVSEFVQDGQTKKMFDWWPSTYELNRVRLMPKKV